MAYDNTHKTLREATNHFLGNEIDSKTLDLSTVDNEAAREILLATRAFQEGAFWMSARIYLELTSEAPDVLKAVLTTMEEHRKIADLCKGIALRKAVPNAALSGPRADDGKSDAGPRSA